MELNMNTIAYSVFNELRLEGKFHDLVIRVQDQTFEAHKIIMCNCSPYFRTLFADTWNDEGRQEFTIPGVEPDIMGYIIEYAYTDALPITCDNVQQLLIAADQFNVMGIIYLCSAFLREHINLDTCIDIYRLSIAFSLSELKQTAFTFLLQNFMSLASGPGAGLCKLTVNELELVLSQDELNVHSEDCAYDALLVWLSEDVEARKQYMPQLLVKLRLSLIREDIFLSRLNQFEQLKDNIDCRNMIVSNVPMLLLTQQPRLRRLRLPNSVLFAVGGWSGADPTNAVEVFDTLNGMWHNVSTDQLSPRGYHGTAYLHPHLYMVGGFTRVAYLNSVRRLHLGSGLWEQAAPMHVCRSYVSVTILGGTLYALGGSDGSERFSSAENYDPNTNQWSMIASMHEARSDASATALGGKVYICGGYNGLDCLFTAEYYTPETDTWTLISPMHVRRSGIGVIACGNHVIAVGGYDGNGRLHSAEQYCPPTDSWLLLPDMITPRSNFGIEEVDGVVYVAGGYDGVSTTFNVEGYNSIERRWFSVSNMDVCRSALGCCVVSRLPNLRDYVAPRDEEGAEAAFNAAP